MELGPTLARIDTGRGRERLFEDQAPGLLKRLSEDARVASITASNAIEGVVVEDEAAERIAEGSSRLRNRNEKEFAGYRDATDTLIGLSSPEPLTIPFLLRLHRQLFHYAGGRGRNLKSDQNLILLSELLARYEESKREGRAHPLILTAALILDFLAIHPVADGNGRLARLLTMHELLKDGYGVARYVSVEQLVFESRNSYYASLYESQREWHEGAHSIWPWTSYLAITLADAYSIFEQRLADSGDSGNKQERVRDYVLRQAPEEFRWRDVERAFPDISNPTIRLVLNRLRDEGKIKSTGSGPAARWHRMQ
jgi:Fic family protein